MTARTRLLVPLLALTTLLGACSDDGGSDEGAPASVVVEDVLVASTDDVIVPSYEALVAAFDDLSADLDALCAAPSTEGLDAARDAWRQASIAWRRARAGGVGPAMERRLASTIAFSARPDDIAALLAGSDAVDEAGVDAAGASVKGIVALEIALFGDGADDLATPVGARRCEYATSVTALARAASAEVLTDWTGGYRDDFVEGMDGDPQASLDELVNEVIFRLTEVDEQGLRALVEAGSVDELAESRRDGPAAFRLAELRATYEGVAAILGEGRLQEIVAATSGDTGDRLAEATAAADAAVAELPDSVTAAFGQPVVTTAQEATMALRVLLATEVASELGVTITFSDSDGDS